MEFIKKTESIKKIYYKPKVPLILQEMDMDLEEFDIRDMIKIDDNLDISKSASKEYSLYEMIENLDEDLHFNFSNNFYQFHSSIHKLKSKLKNPMKMGFEDYKITKEGILLDRNEEIGYFNFGSTIVLIFSIDREIEFNVRVGEKVKIGQRLYDYKNNI